nr:immunoglobulin heavy chain junction region [Mus musculus]
CTRFQGLRIYAMDYW